MDWCRMGDKSSEPTMTQVRDALSHHKHTVTRDYVDLEVAVHGIPRELTSVFEDWIWLIAAKYNLNRNIWPNKENF